MCGTRIWNHLKVNFIRFFYPAIVIIKIQDKIKDMSQRIKQGAKNVDCDTDMESKV